MKRLRVSAPGLVLAGGLALPLSILLMQPKLVATSAAANLAQRSTAGEADPDNPRTEPAPPPDQTYIGTTKCAACHFEQFLDWRQQQQKHAKAFDVLPAKYHKNDECLGCHTTGYGEKTGFRSAADRHLAGVTCEACHGPGSIHAEVSKPFANKKKLTAEEQKVARDSIYLMLPRNACVTCHSTRAHQKHPKYDKG